jgi:hypothetical protein
MPLLSKMVWHSFMRLLLELLGVLSDCRCNELFDSKLGGPAGSYEQVRLPFAGLHLFDVHMK